jgi:Polyketide cyclase / dehydrase and lipid transport
MSARSTWQTEFSVETSAPVEVIWQVFSDVGTWKSWNPGIESIAIEGPFASGTWFSMKPPGQDTLRSRLIEVRQNECFVDETCVGELIVRVAHRIQRLGPASTRVTYSVEAQGPDAAEIGAAVSADFPDVLASLAALAEQKCSTDK